MPVSASQSNELKTEGTAPETNPETFLGLRTPKRAFLCSAASYIYEQSR